MFSRKTNWSNVGPIRFKDDSKKSIKWAFSFEPCLLPHAILMVWLMLRKSLQQAGQSNCSAIKKGDQPIAPTVLFLVLIFVLSYLQLTNALMISEFNKNAVKIVYITFEELMNNNEFFCLSLFVRCKNI